GRRRGRRPTEGRRAHAAADGLRREPGLTARLLERLQARVEIEIEVALPLSVAVDGELHLLDLATQSGDVGTQLIDPRRHRDQTLVLELPLDAPQARVEIREPQIDGILGRRERSASGDDERRGYGD